MNLKEQKENYFSSPTKAIKPVYIFTSGELYVSLSQLLKLHSDLCFIPFGLMTLHSEIQAIWICKGGKVGSKTINSRKPTMKSCTPYETI